MTDGAGTVTYQYDGLDRVVGQTDRLGSVVNLSDQYGRIAARADYSDWGEVRAYTSITVTGGLRTLLPEITYATHQYDDILDLYYAKARFYDPDNRRFQAADPVKGEIVDPLSLVQYLYVLDNPLNMIDLNGRDAADVDGGSRSYGHTTSSSIITTRETSTKATKPSTTPTTGKQTRMPGTQSTEALTTSTMYLDNQTITVVERNGQQLASVRDLIEAYGGGTLQLRSSNGGRNVFYQSSSNIADIYTAQLYYRSNTRNEKRLDIYGDGKSASIGGAHFTVIDDTNYIPISYFQAFMCSNFDVTKVLSTEAPQAPDIYYYYEESGKGRISMGYADIDTGLNFNGSTAISETIASRGNTNTSGKQSGFGVDIVNAEAGFISADYEDDYWGFGVDVLHGEASASITTESGVEIGAVAELAGAEGSVYIPLFNSGYDIVLTGDVSLGGIGGELNISLNEGIGAKLVLGIGAGFNISIRKSD